MVLSIPKAELTGVFLESLAYGFVIPRLSLFSILIFSLGVYLMVFNQCMFVLRKRRSRPSDYLVGTAVSLFILITAVRVYSAQHHPLSYVCRSSTLSSISCAIWRPSPQTNQCPIIQAHTMAHGTLGKTSSRAVCMLPLH
jgi:hypothetical protein